MRILVARLLFVMLAFLSFGRATASEHCKQDHDVLGTGRILKVDTSSGPLFGTLQYEDTLALKDKEVVLTFDDGPHPENTQLVLAALEKECVQATFFPVGMMARKYPEALKKVAESGHTVGAHTFSHPNIGRMSRSGAMKQIERGFEVIDAAVDGNIAPFFRFPGLNHSRAMKAYARHRGLAVFSTDVSSDDWLGIGPRTVVRRTMARLRRKNKGILLFHDTKYRTVLALPLLLKTLKKEGYRVVHIVPEQSFVPAVSAEMKAFIPGKQATAANPVKN